MKLTKFSRLTGLVGRLIWLVLKSLGGLIYKYRRRIGFALLSLIPISFGVMIVWSLAWSIYDVLTLPSDTYGYGSSHHPMRGMTTRAALWGGLAGLVIGGGLAVLRVLVSEHGWKMAAGLLFFLIFIGETSEGLAIPSLTSVGSGITSFYCGLALIASLFLKVTPKTELPNVFGSSRWANALDLRRWRLLRNAPIGRTLEHTGHDGLFLGLDEEDGGAIVYTGDMHALTIAPTRTGKDQCQILPNLERSHSSMFVIDPKGESTRRSLMRRIELGGRAVAVDPWGITTEADRDGPGIDERYLARFNPLDALRPDDPDLPTDTMMLADSLIIPSKQEPHWSHEAAALLHGIILYVVTDEREAGQRHLGRVRDIICLPPAQPVPDSESAILTKTGLKPKKGPDLKGTFDEIVGRMAASDYRLVQSAAHRIMQKHGKEKSSVISTAQANTHFLDSPAIRKSLEVSDFSFTDLKGGVPLTVYLALPLDRLPSFNRWLRLMVTTALMQLTRTPSKDGAPSVRMILNEFAALGKLESVETAYGTMAGLGVQLWAITQDLSQLMRLYGDKGWQTFVANAGVFSYYGSRDHATAKYAEHLTGMTTLKKRSISFGTNWSKGGSSGVQGGGSNWSEGGNESTTIDDVQRPLAFADELMTLDRDKQLLFIENRYPILARKWWWYKNQ
ncbi:type IV secretory system conjugative DNA transfer family protein [Parvularcula marina]|uniref:type IV secretory system conjugative DNA transfer family protein n=1 Tax=Parvularcula marina TaxID=2292771 RepID=UPI003515BCD0